MSTANPTELQLQLALAKELPELIYTGFGPNHPFVWKGEAYSEAWPDVTPREWDWIVRECEKKLTADNHYTFRKELWDITDQSQDRSWRGVNGEEHNRRFVSASWPQRAIAYFRTIGKEIV